MSNDPLISIAVPNFNYAKYLPRCIQSVMDQVGDDIEVLIADNCSTDASWSIIREFKDQRLRVWRHKENIGLFPNWNFLLQQARGRFFKLLPSDDWLEPDFAIRLRECLGDLPASSIAAILFGHRMCDERARTLQGQLSEPQLPSAHNIPPVFSPGENFAAVFESLAYAMPTFNALATNLALRVGGYRPEDAMRSDGILFSRVLAAEPSWSVVSCNASVAVARIHAANDRWKYSRFAAFRDELIFLCELKGLTHDGRDRRILGQSISLASAQALISLPLDLIRRRSFRGSAKDTLWLLRSGLSSRAVAAAPKEAYKIALTRRKSVR
jgi:glycosyltransferase involved in cell wall biosynthesis